jgi:CBS domain containing-hemolysin-like protein
VRAAPTAPVTTVTTPVLHVDAGLSLLDAVSVMRAQHAQLVLVDEGSAPIGLVTMEDLLERVLGRFDDETDA